MRRLFALLLILCLVPCFCVAETITHDFGDFYMTLPADIVGQLNEKTSGGYFFVLYPALDQNASFHPNINCVWQDVYTDISILDPEQVAQSGMDYLISSMAQQNITITNPKILDASFSTVSGKDALSCSLVYDIDYHDLGLKTTLYVIQAVVSEEAMKSYTFTFTTDNVRNTEEAFQILDSITWKK